ncbi:Uncharacterised protein [Mycobacteroides abscessus subsp. abscessus]|nr:Uncharacterised protein [Mycobacteroides abscessus subsp. abscessus]
MPVTTPSARTTSRVTSAVVVASAVRPPTVVGICCTVGISVLPTLTRLPSRRWYNDACVAK